MSDYNKIQEHMINKFNLAEKVVQLENVPNVEMVKEMSDKILYKVPLIAVAVDIADFKKYNQHSNPEVLSKIMSEFVWGVTKIMKEYDVIQIDMQGDGILGIMPSSNYQKDNVKAFNLACSLNSFQSHIKKNIDKFFTKDEVKKDGSNYSHTTAPSENFKFGIGLFFSFDNYVSKVGHGTTKELIFMGESVNGATFLANKANRNDINNIAMNDLLYINFTDEEKEKINKVGGFSSHDSYDEIKGKIWHCNWIIADYSNFVESNV